MAFLLINGLPRNLSKTKIAQLLKSSCLPAKTLNFWVCFIKGKKACLKFGSREEAETARQFLDGSSVAYYEKEYVIHVEFSENGDLRESHSNYEETDKRIPEKRKFTNDQFSKVNMEIELVKKQRILVEEEKKLLLEKKKLAILKSVCSKSTPDEIEDLLRCKSATADTVIGQVNDQEMKEFLSLQQTKASPLPYFYKIRKVLYIQMKTILDKYTTNANKLLMRTLWNTKVRTRLATLLDNKRNLTGSEIISLYRDKYPPSSDEEFIKELLKTADLSLIAPEPKESNGQAGSNLDTGINPKADKKKEIDEPAELNAEIDMENDCDDWTDDDQDESKQDVKLESDDFDFKDFTDAKDASEITPIIDNATKEPKVEENTVVNKE